MLAAIHAVVKQAIPGVVRGKFRDACETFYRMFPGPMAGLARHGLSETQIYPLGRNMMLHIKAATEKKFERLSVDTKTPVASIGTCFAEEFASHMKNAGGNYLYEEENVFNSSANWGRVYTVPNLLQIVRYSLTDEVPVQIEHSKDGFFDPLREKSVGFHSSREAAQKSIASHREASARIFRSASLLVMTLGQNEAWLDKDNDLVWGSIPPSELLKQNPSRFVPVEFDYERNLRDLTAVLGLLYSQNSAIRIILTVSPVAAYATFLSKDVVTQSFAGKCMLRSVVHDIQKKFADVLYFPSFEIVLCENPKKFRADNRHVKRGTVNEIFSLLGHALK